jgi:hypothetical protein
LTQSQFAWFCQEKLTEVSPTDRSGLTIHEALTLRARLTGNVTKPAQVHNHFNQERHLVTQQVYKQRRTAALAEWRALAA